MHKIRARCYEDLKELSDVTMSSLYSFDQMRLSHDETRETVEPS